MTSGTDNEESKSGTQTRNRPYCKREKRERAARGDIKRVLYPFFVAKAVTEAHRNQPLGLL